MLPAASKCLKVFFITLFKIYSLVCFSGLESHHDGLEGYCDGLELKDLFHQPLETGFGSLASEFGPMLAEASTSFQSFPELMGWGPLEHLTTHESVHVPQAYEHANLPIDVPQSHEYSNRNVPQTYEYSDLNGSQAHEHSNLNGPQVPEYSDLNVPQTYEYFDPLSHKRKSDDALEDIYQRPFKFHNPVAAPFNVENKANLEAMESYLLPHHSESTYHIMENQPVPASFWLHETNNPLFFEDQGQSQSSSHDRSLRPSGSFDTHTPVNSHHLVAPSEMHAPAMNPLHFAPSSSETHQPLNSIMDHQLRHILPNNDSRDPLVLPIQPSSMLTQNFHNYADGVHFFGGVNDGSFNPARVCLEDSVVISNLKFPSVYQKPDMSLVLIKEYQIRNIINQRLGKDKDSEALVGLMIRICHRHTAFFLLFNHSDDLKNEVQLISRRGGTEVIKMQIL